MDIMTQQVINIAELGSRHLRRKLGSEVSETALISLVGLPSSGACPLEVLNDIEIAECATIQHLLTLITDEKDPTLVQSQFQNAVDESIRGGELQRILIENYPESSLFVVTGYSGLVPQPGGTRGTGGSNVLNTGARAGIAIGAVVVVVAAAALLYTYRRGAQEKEEETYFPTARQELVTGDIGGDMMPPSPENSMLGANQPDYKMTRKASKQATKILFEEDPSNVALRNHGDGVDSSSNAGSSGWSSSAGVSSLNTGSIESMDIIDKDGLPGTRLATISAQSAMIANRSRKDKSGDDPDVPNVSRVDLDSAIESGDWAAVGATAALLAAASDSQSYSSRSRRTDTSMSRGGSSVSSLDAARAAELDHLVDAGDWEGVVVAAAKYEASEDTSTAGSRGSRGAHTAGGSSGYSQSGSLSESPSKAAKRGEIRNEVESLVRRVVPEEIDNVDEMMLQFKGREEELVETLRTMQERQVAQKARVQGQKQAKRDARQTAREGGIVLPGPPITKTEESNAESFSLSDQLASPASASSRNEGISEAAAKGIGVGVAAAAGIAAAVNMGVERDDSTSSFESGSSVSGSSFAEGAALPVIGDGDFSMGSSTDNSGISSTKRRTALELAIEAGDWEAVGEAAAMMSDASVTTADTGEIERIVEGDNSTKSEDSRFKVDAERASELDEMINEGNWSGVVAAASRYSTVDSGFVGEAAEDIPRSGDFSLSVDSDVQKEANTLDEGKKKRIKEEQEALAQAEMWAAIAEQSKKEGSTDIAASDAADWAIARSLSTLKKAEQKEENQDSDDNSQDKSV